jgi:hypothetical protein
MNCISFFNSKIVLICKEKFENTKKDNQRRTDNEHFKTKRQKDKQRSTKH